MAASVVPPGDVTFFLNSPAVSFEVANKFAAPNSVYYAKSLESSSLKPNYLAANCIASAR